jgi:hypothetical protein
MAASDCDDKGCRACDEANRRDYARHDAVSTIEGVSGNDHRDALL